MTKREYTGFVICKWGCGCVNRCSADIVTEDYSRAMRGILNHETLLVRFPRGRAPAYCPAKRMKLVEEES